MLTYRGCTVRFIYVARTEKRRNSSCARIGVAAINLASFSYEDSEAGLT